MLFCYNSRYATTPAPPAPPAATLLPQAPGLQLDALDVMPTAIVITLTGTSPCAPCPDCGTPSLRVRVRYLRTLADLPWGPVPVTLSLQVRKFACTVTTCRRRIFTERLPDVVAPMPDAPCASITLCSASGLHWVARRAVGCSTACTWPHFPQWCPYHHNRFSSSSRVTIAARDVTSSFANIRRRWVPTVHGLISRISPIHLLGRPLATRLAMASSRGLRLTWVGANGRRRTR